MTQETITAEQLASRLRYDRYLTTDNSLYIAALASRDTPAGKLSQYGGQVGYSRQLYKSKTAETVAEIGYDFARETLTTGDPISIHSGRGFIGHHAVMTTDTVLDTSIEALTNFNRETLPTGTGWRRVQGYARQPQGRDLGEDRREPRRPDIVRGAVRQSPRPPADQEPSHRASSPRPRRSRRS